MYRQYITFLQSNKQVAHNRAEVRLNPTYTEEIKHAQPIVTNFKICILVPEKDEILGKLNS